MLAISDYRAATYILGEHVFDFPKPQGVREWFRLLVGEGLLVAEGANPVTFVNHINTYVACAGKEAHARQRRTFSPALQLVVLLTHLGTLNPLYIQSTGNPALTQHILFNSIEGMIFAILKNESLLHTSCLPDGRYFVKPDRRSPGWSH